MNRLVILVLLFFTNICIAQIKPEFSTHYDYKVIKTFYRTNSHADSDSRTQFRNSGRLYTGGNKALEVQYATHLSNLADSGWNLVETIEYKKDSGNVQYRKYHELYVIFVARKIIKDPTSELEKKIDYYSKIYADSIRREMIKTINNMTWVQMGAFYKDDIVAEMIKQTAFLMEENNKIILQFIKNNRQ